MRDTAGACLFRRGEGGGVGRVLTHRGSPDGKSSLARSYEANLIQARTRLKASSRAGISKRPHPVQAARLLIPGFEPSGKKCRRALAGDPKDTYFHGF